MEVKISQQSRYPIDYHFRGKRANMKPLFAQLIKRLRKEIDFEYKIGKAYIGLIRTLVFAAFRIQTQKIIVEFTARKKLKSPRFTKILHFQKQRWAYFLNVKESKDVDSELLGWIADSCE